MSKYMVFPKKTDKTLLATDGHGDYMVVLEVYLLSVEKMHVHQIKDRVTVNDFI